jgi:lysine-N-methylase
LNRPDYAESFRCIGSACEDTCCRGWGIPVDQVAYEKYRNLPASPLRTLIQISCVIAPVGESDTDGPRQANSLGPIFARMRMTSANQCPLFSEDGLCSIQKEYGETLLPATCAIYPRIVHWNDGIEEKALALSCPEAARLVLLNPNLLSAVQPVPRNPPGMDAVSDPVQGEDHAGSLRCWFWPIRESVLALVRNRSYPLWQRLLLMGVFCRRLDSIDNGEPRVSVPVFLRDFEGSIASGSLLAEMEATETFPVDLTLQLDVVLQLAGMMLHQSNVLPRFVECIHAFTTGIGNGPGATLASLTAHYARAHDRFFAPFFDRHPYILENYLINAILRYQFPLREEPAGTLTSIARQHAQLSAQFALMKGLLIGVAGFHGEAFSTDHVVHTVQAASKHFEHHPEFLNQAYALLLENKMIGARGLAILLRNTGSVLSRPASCDAPFSQPTAW